MTASKRNKRIYVKILSAVIVLGVIFIVTLVHETTKEGSDIITIYSDGAYNDQIREVLSAARVNNYNIVDDLSSADLAISADKYEDFDIITTRNDIYAPVVPIQDQMDNITSENLKGLMLKEGSDIVISESEEYTKAFSRFFGESSSISRTKTDQIAKSLLSGQNAMSFVKIQDMTPEMNALLVDNMSAFDTNNPNYPYRISVYFMERKRLNIKSEAKTKIEEYFNQNSAITEVLAVGDMMLSRHVGTKIVESGDASLPFRKMSDFLSSADITFGNLESPFYDQGSRVTEGMVFKAEPETIAGLKLAGFDIVSLANNHFGNQGRKGMIFSFKHLADNGIAYCGAGNNTSEAHQFKILERNGLRFSFLSYNNISPKSYEASEDNPGLAWISGEKNDLLAMEKDIKNAKKNSDVVIASFHWGTEYTPIPTSEQRMIASRAITAGADVIISQHPHVVQAIEYIEGKPVFYSLGNFVFDQMWSEETREGVILKEYFLGNKLINFDFIPIKIEDFNQPRRASIEESRNILNRIFSNSNLK